MSTAEQNKVQNQTDFAAYVAIFDDRGDVGCQVRYKGKGKVAVCPMNEGIPVEGLTRIFDAKTGRRLDSRE